MEDFSRFKIKDYHYWTVNIHEYQNYLGRCVIWCKRANALDLSDATPEEQEELFVIVRKLRTMSEKAFKADWFNYAFLGNETKHLHGHFIPRYASEREFAGIKFKDERWRRIYLTDKSFVVPAEVLEQIKQKIKETLDSLD